MALSLTSGNDGKLSLGYGVEAEGPGTLEFNERTFRKSIMDELKRSAITKGPFVLMFVSLAEIPADCEGCSPRKQVVASLASSIRDTDVLGWYKTGMVIGIVFTEIGDSAGPAIDSIMERVNDGLTSCLCGDDIKKLSIAGYLVHKEEKRGDPPIGARLLHGLARIGSSRKSAPTKESAYRG